MNSLAQATWIQPLNYSYKNCMIIFTETNPSNFVNYLSCGQFPFFPEICGLPNYRAQRKKGKEKGKDKKKRKKKEAKYGEKQSSCKNISSKVLEAQLYLPLKFM